MPRLVRIRPLRVQMLEFLWVSSSFRIRLEFDSAESEWNRGLMFDEWDAEGRKRQKKKKNNKTEGIPRIFLLFYYTSSLPLLIRLIRAVYINLKQWAFHKSQCIVSEPPQAITTMMTIKSPFSAVLTRARDENEIKQPMTYNITDRVSERSSPLRKGGLDIHTWGNRNIVRFHSQLEKLQIKKSLCASHRQQSF